MDNTKEDRDTLLLKDDSEVVGYVRVSMDLQDIGKQKDTIRHWARREGLKVSRFVGGEISSTLIARK